MQTDLFEQRQLITHRAPVRRPAPAAPVDPDNQASRGTKLGRLRIRRTRAAAFREDVQAVLRAFEPTAGSTAEPRGDGGAPPFGSFLRKSAGGCVGCTS